MATERERERDNETIHIAWGEGRPWVHEKTREALGYSGDGKMGNGNELRHRARPGRLGSGLMLVWIRRADVWRKERPLHSCRMPFWIYSGATDERPHQTRLSMLHAPRLRQARQEGSTGTTQVLTSVRMRARAPSRR